MKHFTFSYNDGHNQLTISATEHDVKKRYELFMKTIDGFVDNNHNSLMLKDNTTSGDIAISSSKGYIFANATSNVTTKLDNEMDDSSNFCGAI